MDDPPPQGSTAPLIDWEAPVEVGGEIRTPIPVHEFVKHTAELHADGDIGFSKEYEAIQNESINEEYPSEHSQHPDNKQKNRYLNIIACMYLIKLPRIYLCHFTWVLFVHLLCVNR